MTARGRRVLGVSTSLDTRGGEEVLHGINFAGHYADRICAVKDGQVIEFGTPDEVLTDEVLSRVFDTPVQMVDGPTGRLAVYY